MYDTDMDDKMGLTRSPAKPPLQDDGLDIQATQAGVTTPPLPHTLPLLAVDTVGCRTTKAKTMLSYPHSA